MTIQGKYYKECLQNSEHICAKEFCCMKDRYSQYHEDYLTPIRPRYRVTEISPRNWTIIVALIVAWCIIYLYKPEHFLAEFNLYNINGRFFKIKRIV